MAKKSLKAAILGLGFGLGLAFAMPYYAQEKDIPIKIEQPEFNPNYWTADGILVTPSIVSLSRDKDINIDFLISGGNVTKIDAMDPIDLINGKLNFLNSKRAKAFYSQEDRQRIIGLYTGLLSRVKNEKRTSEYYKSLENLSKEINVNQRTITKEELETLAEGIYAIDKQGTDSKVGAYDAPMLVYFGPKDKDSKLDSKTSKVKEKTLVDLVFGVNASSSLDYFEGEIGAQVRPLHNKKIAFGLIANYGLSLDKTVNSYNDSLPFGIATSGAETNTNHSSVGISAETQLGPFILGGGIDYSSFIDKNTAQIYQNGQEIKSSADSTPDSKVYGKVYGGLGAQISDNVGVRVILGYNGEKGLYFGIGTSIRLNPGK